jgi:dihydropteroate synthase
LDAITSIFEMALPRLTNMFILPPGRPALMGILNVTPDSFSDGGLHFKTEDAVDAAQRMMDEGADIIDVGGESTRPGSEGVTTEEEISRVIPVVQKLVAKGIVVSIDTAKSEVASEALESGAEVVNDVTAFGDPEMSKVCAEAKCTVCLMHMKGTPRTMQSDPQYDDVVEEVQAYLVSKAALAKRAGIARENIWIDPGIGFGKTVEHNLELMRKLDRFVESGYPVLIGTSRKSFIGKLLGGEGNPLPADERLEGTLATQIWAQTKGAKIIRTHDVKEARRAIDMTASLMKS